MNIITVVYSTDYNYLRYTIVSAFSLLTNLKEGVFCEIIFLVPENMPNCTEAIIRDTLQDFSNCSIRLIRMGDEFHNAALLIKHITTPTYYRLLLPELLPETKRCVYLDGDTIVSGDISELYDYDLRGQWIGGAKGLAFYKHERYTRKRLSYNCNQPFLYINAGVLLLDLDQLRRNSVSKRMLESISKNYAVQDQDIINVCCMGKIEPLPMFFNAMTKYISCSFWSVSRFVSKSEYNRCVEKPVVIHFADRTKPWTDASIPFAEKWYEYALAPSCWRLFDNESRPLLLSVIRRNTKVFKKCLFYWTRRRNRQFPFS